MELSRRTALVTGGAAGIGRGIAIELARGGAEVVVADITREPKLEYDRGTTVDVIESLDGNAMFRHCDVTEESAVESTVEETVANYGNLDILVNNAGISTTGSVTDLDSDAWDHITDVNLTSVFLTTKHAPHISNRVTLAG